jgi:hypothetical protein
MEEKQWSDAKRIQPIGGGEIRTLGHFLKQTFLEELSKQAKKSMRLCEVQAPMRKSDK